MKIVYIDVLRIPQVAATTIFSYPATGSVTAELLTNSSTLPVWGAALNS